MLSDNAKAHEKELIELNKARAKELHDLTEGAFCYLDCRKALMINTQDPKRALNWLMSGGWIGCKLITWDTESLTKKAVLLKERVGDISDSHAETLMKCGGNVNLAEMVIKGEDVYDKLLEDRVNRQHAANRAAAALQ